MLETADAHRGFETTANLVRLFDLERFCEVSKSFWTKRPSGI